MPHILVHRYSATDAGTPVNTYVLERPAGVVLVDATLTVRALGGGHYNIALAGTMAAT